MDGSRAHSTRNSVGRRFRYKQMRSKLLSEVNRARAEARCQEHFINFADTWIKGAMDHYPEVVDGYFALPERPGLGVTLREDFVGNHPREQVFFNLIRGRLAQAPKEDKSLTPQAPQQRCNASGSIRMTLMAASAT